MRFRILGVSQSKAKNQVREKFRDALCVVYVCSRDCPTGAAGFGVLAALQDRRCDLAWVTAGERQEIVKGQQLGKYHEQSDSSKGFGTGEQGYPPFPGAKSHGFEQGLNNSLPGCCGRASAGVLDIGMGQLGRGGLGNE